MSKNPKTILIGTSLTEASDEVVRVGGAVARTTGAAVHLFHTYMPPAFPPEVAGVAGPWIEQMEEALREVAAATCRCAQMP